MSARRKKKTTRGPSKPSTTTLRVVGGRLRGSKLQYSGDPRVRPMKDRTREAAFNLIGPIPAAAHVIDLFAGTGAMGIEAMSRGASSATLLEIHVPTARLIRQNVQALSLSDVQVISADVFHWVRQCPDLPGTPWIVFCSPPYRFYDERPDELLTMLGELERRAAPRTIFVVEADQSFDVDRLSEALKWRVRDYPPARVAVGRM